MIENNPQTTLMEMKNRLSNENELNVSTESIRKALKGLLITLKKVNLTSININSNFNKSRRYDYARKFMDLDENKIKIFLDESGFNLHLRRTLGRSQRGSTVSVLVPASKGVKYKPNIGNIKRRGDIC